MTITLNSVEDALQYLADFQGDGESDAPTAVFGEELGKISIGIAGPRYHSSIPSELARGIWEYQEALYKAVAFALYEVEDIRRLTFEQRRQFELVFKVTEGSTELVAELKDFIEKLGEGFLTMESKHKAYVLVAIVLILTSGWAATRIVESQAEVKEAEFKATTQVQLDQEKTKQFEVFSGLARQSVVAAFTKASEEGAKAIVRHTPDASKVKIGRTSIDRAEIEEVNRRASMERNTAEIVTEDFRVYGTYAKDASSTKYILGRKDGSEFNVVVSHDDLTISELEKLWAAARDRKPLGLEVNLTLSKGSVRAAQIVKVL